GPLWRATQWWQIKKWQSMLEYPCRQANPSRWSSTKNGSLGGSRRRRQPTVSRAWLSSLNEVPKGSRNSSRWRISRGSEIIYRRIRNYARRRRKERRCGKADQGGWVHLRDVSTHVVSLSPTADGSGLFPSHQRGVNETVISPRRGVTEPRVALCAGAGAKWLFREFGGLSVIEFLAPDF